MSSTLRAPKLYCTQILRLTEGQTKQRWGTSGVTCHPICSMYLHETLGPGGKKGQSNVILLNVQTETRDQIKVNLTSRLKYNED